MNHDLIPWLMLALYISLLAAILGVNTESNRRTDEIIAAIEACACECPTVECPTVECPTADDSAAVVEYCIDVYNTFRDAQAWSNAARDFCNDQIREEATR